MARELPIKDGRLETDLDANGHTIKNLPAGFLPGKADLVDGKVPSSQLPSYVDDVIEVANYAALPATGERGKIYVTLDTNVQYRWTGTQYVEIAKIVEPATAAPQMDGKAAVGNSQKYARENHVHPTDTTRASTADATLVNASNWVCSPANIGGSPVYIIQNLSGAWYPSDGEGSIGAVKGDAQSLTLSWAADEWYGGVALTATRVALGGYVLGSQTDKPLASEAEAEALRTGKANLSNGKVPTSELPDGTTNGKGIVQLDTALTASGKAADAKATGDALALIAPDWSQSNSYQQYDVVKKDGACYYAKDAIAANTAWNADNWGSLANLAALAHKFLPLTGGTMTGPLTMDRSVIELKDSVGYKRVLRCTGTGGDFYIDYYDAQGTLVSSIFIPSLNGTLALAAPNSTAGNLAALDANGNPTNSGVKASDKLDSTSAAPAYDATATYAVGDHVTYNGALYRCTTAVTTAGAWTGSTNWTAEDMTTPDATLDVTATDKLLRLVATNGDIIWGQGYNLSTESSATVITEQVSAFTFAADAAADQAIVLPSIAAGKVGDFILDVTNLSANDRSLTLTGLDSAFSVVVKAGDDLSETLTVAAGEMARYYFTMTAFRVNSLPTWQVAKEAVENGGAQS